MCRRVIVRLMCNPNDIFCIVAFSWENCTYNIYVFFLLYLHLKVYFSCGTWDYALHWVPFAFPGTKSFSLSRKHGIQTSQDQCGAARWHKGQLINQSSSLHRGETVSISALSPQLDVETVEGITFPTHWDKPVIYAVHSPSRRSKRKVLGAAISHEHTISHLSFKDLR